MKINLPKDVNDILDSLESAGYESYVVGGCVRDSILDREPHDWDITTSATPDEMKRALNLKSIDTGLKHGTVTFVSNKEPYEVTTFREDGEYSDGRRPDSVSFTKSIEKDLSRRDFTMNAMAYSPKRGLKDPFNGANDLRNKLLRTVGDPNKRFQEDGLRILRGVRFAANYNLDIERFTSEAMHNNLDCLDNISKERIKTELFKTLSAEDGKKVSDLLGDYKDVVFKSIPQLGVLDDFDQNNKHHNKDLLDHTLEVVAGVSNNPELRMAALLHDIGKPSVAKLGEDGYLHFVGHPKVGKDMAEDICKYLKMSNEEIENISLIVSEHDNRPAPTNKSVRRFIAKFNSDYLAENSLELMESDIKAHTPESIEKLLPEFEKAKALYFEERENQNTFSIKDLAINGNDLIKAGIPQGKQVGERLNELLKLVVDGEIENNRKELMRYTDTDLIYVREHTRKGNIVRAHFRKRKNR